MKWLATAHRLGGFEENLLPSLSFGLSELAMPSSDPLKSLMCALLLQAIEDVQSSGIDRREAERYIRGQGDYGSDYLFSFISVCEFVGINPDALRERIFSSKGKIVKMRHRTVFRLPQSRAV